MEMDKEEAADRLTSDCLVKTHFLPTGQTGLTTTFPLIKASQGVHYLEQTG